MVAVLDRLFEAHLTVANLATSIAFYREHLGLELAHEEPARRAAFLWIGSRGHTMLGLWGADPGSPKTTTHIAFAAALEDVIAAPRRLQSAGITTLDFYGEPTDEPVVLAWMPAASVYFRDPDGHLLEYIAMLDDPPRPDDGVLTWHDWTRGRSEARGHSTVQPGSGHRTSTWRSRQVSSGACMIPKYTITEARPEDLTRLPAIELAAARLFVGRAPESVLNETTTPDVLEKARREGHLWVALADDVPVGFAHVEVIERDAVHLEEIDVHPDHGRRGVGTRLVSQVCHWAARNGYGAVTLATFRDVPWNLPFYARLGFDIVPPEQLSPSLRAVVENETRRGLDPSRRAVMRRPSAS